MTAVFGRGSGDHEGGRDREDGGSEASTRGRSSIPLSALQAYRDQPSAAEARKRNLVSYRLGAHGVNLPSALTFSPDE